MAFKILIEIINSALDILNKYKFHVYDNDDAGWYLTEVFYKEDEDKIYFKCREEK